METLTFYPIDLSYRLESDKPQILIYGKTSNGDKVCIVDNSFEPYFLVHLKDESVFRDIKNDLLNFKIADAQIVKIQEIQKKILGKTQKLLKVFTQQPDQVPIAAKFISELEIVASVYESDIKFVLRYLIDKKITPMVLTEAKGMFINNEFRAESVLQKSQDSSVELNVMGFDIETYCKKGSPIMPEKDPIIMLSLYGKNLKKVLTWKKFKHTLDYVEHLDSEKELIERFKVLINQEKPDALVGYNSDGFDFPYIETRANKFNITLNLFEGNLLKIKNNEARIIGLPHVDIYKFIVRVMSRALRLSFYTLNDVSEKLLNEKKIEVKIEEMFLAWDNNKGLGKFCEYNLKDSELAYLLFQKVFPNILELIKIIGLPIYNLTRASHSQFVETYILKNTPDYNEVILNRPSYHEKESRYNERYQGAYVYQPIAGLYEDIVIVDFKSFYPTLIVSHNIGPSVLNCKCHPDSRNKIEIGTKTMHFCEGSKGFLPAVLEHLIIARTEVKKQLKKNKDNILLGARSQALKDLSNAFYGYFGFSSARWYNFDCAQAITALASNYIKDTISKAEKAEFKVIYGDTDSVFLSLGKKRISDVEKFVNKINSDLPGCMELEFEGYYPSGIFVSAKASTKGAKKRYALMDERGALTIKGFESVRRNISPIAKEVQENILSILLKEKQQEKAVKYLKQVLYDLRKNLMPIEKLAITMSLQKPIEEYNSLLPHVAIAMQLLRKGEEVYPGMILKYVVVKGKGKLNQRVKLPEDVKPEDYDSGYYINNQIIPAIDKIFEALGYSIEELLMEKNQSSLQSFFL